MTERLSRSNGNYSDAQLIHSDRVTGLFGLIVELVENLVSLFHRFFCNAVCSGYKFFALKSRWNGSLDLVYEILQIFLEDLSLARWEFEGFWLVRILEVVYVAPVRGSRFGFGDFFQVTSSRRPLTRDRRTSGKDVESFSLHLHAEYESFEGAILSNDSFERSEFLPGFAFALSRWP